MKFEEALRIMFENADNIKIKSSKYRPYELGVENYMLYAFPEYSCEYSIPYVIQAHDLDDDWEIVE
jgi:hypothetical protein